MPIFAITFNHNGSLAHQEIYRKSSNLNLLFIRNPTSFEFFADQCLNRSFTAV